jgi:hypothetical protein
LPYTHDTIISGYSLAQWNECVENEKALWAYFVQTGLLTETEPSKIASYVTEGPGTPELSKTAPGNIGTFTGYKIVDTWMKKKNITNLQTLIHTPNTQIFAEAKYQP